MATTNQTATKTEAALELTPPDPVPTVSPERAAGLVPVDEGKKSKLEQQVEAFVSELVALDANSPDFGRKVDQITNMGRKEIAATAQMSNRFLDRPVRAIDKDSGVGADLTELRRTVEELDPGRKSLAPRDPRHHPLWQQAEELLRQLHQRAGAHPGDPRPPRQRQG
jgi:hypothetical protein